MVPALALEFTSELCTWNDKAAIKAIAKIISALIQLVKVRETSRTIETTIKTNFL
jgi:hypothetical protein